jgi:two-component system chemotaxis response regulator CheV
MNQTNILLETGTNELEILEFFITSANDREECETHHFGVNVAKVMEVIASPGLESQPSAPHPSFLGLIPLRSHILPVIDLAVWLNMPKVFSTQDNVIVTEFSQAVTGFLVSGVTEIHRVGWAEVIPPDGYMPKVGLQAIVGLVERGGHFIQLLDLETILADLAPASEDGKAPAFVAEQTLRALVADDSTTIRLMLSRSMTAANFETIVVNNGQEALDKARELARKAQAERRPITDFVDVIVSDIEMPLMDGFTLIKNLKADPLIGALPMILYSSIITQELRHKGESVGADCQISKPEMDKIPEVAARLIAERRMQTSKA